MIDVDWFDLDVPIYSYENPNKYIFENNDIIFATFWLTTTEAIKIPAKRKIYFVLEKIRNLLSWKWSYLPFLFAK